jgi:uncharacterized membrane protein YdjX (TVP38/TMEM64 family)/rhodanese-related sulfurtransferase
MRLRGTVVRIALSALLAAGAVVALLANDQLELVALEAHLRELGLWGPAAFVASFALATVLFVPGSLFGLTGGILFGPLWGTVWNLAGGTLGATISFVVARYIAGSWVATKISGRLQVIVQRVEAEGWRFVALTRLIPVIPFNLLNYALGLTRIRLSQFFLATLVCMAPGAAAYAWLGHAGKAAMAGNSEALRYGLVGLGLFALVAFLPRLVRRMNETPGAWITVAGLKRRLASDAPTIIIDVREPEEFLGPLGRIPGTRNIPLSDVPARLNEISNANGAATILVCRTDKRSAKAAEVLRTGAIRNVCVLQGGMEEWSRSVAALDLNQGTDGRAGG